MAWGGPASVAVYVPCPPGHPLEPAYREHLRRLEQRLRERLAAATAAAAATEVTDAADGSVSAASTPVAAAARLTVTVVHASCLAPEGAAVLPGVVPPLPLPPLAPPSVAPGAAAAAEGGDGQMHDRLYPINALRNAALRAAVSSHVFLVDGDFIPSSGLRHSLLTPQSLPPPSPPTESDAAVDSGPSLLELSDRHEMPVMWVVPAFELTGTSQGQTLAAVSAAGAAASAATGVTSAAEVRVAGGEVPDDLEVWVPRTLEQLAACAGTGMGVGAADAGGTPTSRLQLRPFHCGRYPQPLPSVDYQRWWRRALTRSDGGGELEQQRGDSDGGGGDWMAVPYHEYFEPYGILRRDQVPEYDERFRGYGLNKVQHAYHMAAAGYEFRLLTRHFCVTLPHARSASYRAVFGSAADPGQRVRVERLYDTFKHEMYDKYGYRYVPPSVKLAH